MRGINTPRDQEGRGQHGRQCPRQHHNGVKCAIMSAECFYRCEPVKKPAFFPFNAPPSQECAGCEFVVLTTWHIFFSAQSGTKQLHEPEGCENIKLLQMLHRPTLPPSASPLDLLHLPGISACCAIHHLQSSPLILDSGGVTQTRRRMGQEERLVVF